MEWGFWGRIFAKHWWRAATRLCVDDLSTGRQENLAGLNSVPGFEFLHTDVSEELNVTGSVDAVMHLASPASPPDYLRRPLETLAVGSRGTENAIKLAVKHGARFLLTSTSEVYEDPLVHPQTEAYWGNVNPIGPRSVCDEAKRFSEALTMAYYRTYRVNVSIVRIFNTYGPRLRAGDGRVVSNFITQALAGDPITIYGDGRQTRSFCYVDDLVRGLLGVLDSDFTGPVNLGNPSECTVSELAQLVLELTHSKSVVKTLPLPVDDPVRRWPDISRAHQALGRDPQIDLRTGLLRTINWVRNEGAIDSRAA